MSIGYKVAARSDKPNIYESMSVLYSTIIPVEYRLDCESIRPRGCGPLAIFNTFSAAYAIMCGFYNSNQRLVILECSYIVSKDEMLWYRNPAGKIINLHSIYVPSGTRFADVILPQRIVQTDIK